MLAAGGATVDHNSNKNIVPSTKRVMLAGTEHNSTNVVGGLNKNNTQVPLLSNGQLSKLGDIREKHHGH